ncbi:MAG: hypothetical protein R3D53_08945 [Paracoccaceae bacterium]
MNDTVVVFDRLRENLS